MFSEMMKDSHCFHVWSHFAANLSARQIQTSGGLQPIHPTAGRTISRTVLPDSQSAGEDSGCGCVETTAAPTKTKKANFVRKRWCCSAKSSGIHFTLRVNKSLRWQFLHPCTKWHLPAARQNLCECNFNLARPHRLVLLLGFQLEAVSRAHSLGNFSKQTYRTQRDCIQNNFFRRIYKRGIDLFKHQHIRTMNRWHDSWPIKWSGILKRRLNRIAQLTEPSIIAQSQHVIRNHLIETDTFYTVSVRY